MPLAIHPTTPNQILFGTQNSGAYKWNENTQSWKQLLNFLDYSQKNYYGVQDIVFDPQNANVIYLACGKIFSESKIGKIFKSIDGGESFIPLNINCTVFTETQYGNPNLSVSPFNSNILLYGEPYPHAEQLYKSVDGGITWTPINLGIDNFSILAIAFDDINSNVCYFGTNGSVYKSNDNGSTWVKMTTVGDVKKMVCVDGVLWVVTFSQGASFAGVLKYNNGNWSNVTPQEMSGNRAYFDLLAVNPNNSNEVVAGISYYRLWFHTINGGSTWRKILDLENYIPGENSNNIVFNISDKPAWMNANLSKMILTQKVDICFDPHNSGRLWFANMWGAFCTDNISSQVVSFVHKNKNIFQSSHVQLFVGADNKLLSTSLSLVTSFKHLSLMDTPLEQNAANTSYFLDKIESISQSQSHPNILYRLGITYTPEEDKQDTSYRLQKTSNSGDTWIDIPAYYNLKRCYAENDCESITPIQVIVSDSNPNLLLIFTSNKTIFYTLNSGNTFAEHLFNLRFNYSTNYRLSRNIVSVGEDFFYYNPEYDENANNSYWGSFFKFFLDSNELSIEETKPLPQSTRCDLIKSNEGVLYIALMENGLWRCTDGNGSYWTQINPTHIDYAVTIGIGLPVAGNTASTFYIYGSVRGEWGLYWCPENDFSNLTKISTPEFAIGNEPHHLVTSIVNPGEIFLATDGSGILHCLHQ